MDSNAGQSFRYGLWPGLKHLEEFYKLLTFCDSDSGDQLFFTEFDLDSNLLELELLLYDQDFESKPSGVYLDYTQSLFGNLELDYIDQQRQFLALDPDSTLFSFWHCLWISSNMFGSHSVWLELFCTTRLCYFQK